MIDDFFALLGEERRPWLDAERVKETFHRLSRTEHPDQQSGVVADKSDAGFARLNLAQTTLRDPKARLRHLLELEHPEIKLAGPANVPAALADCFAPVHELLQEVDGLLVKKNTTVSALAKALLARQEWALREKTEERLVELETLHRVAREELLDFDAAWQQRRPDDSTGRLRDFYQRFAYLSRWIEQLRERLFQLGV